MQHEQILSFFSKYIENELGIVYADHNYFQLQNRLDEMSKLLGLESIEALYTHSQKGITGASRQLLLDIATNNETSFFRDPKAFKAVQSTILPSFQKSHYPNWKMRIWSAASSTGQEALSIAMQVCEFNNTAPSPIQFHITATDISERVLSRAKSATYTQLEVQRGLPAPMMIKYFKKDELDNWKAETNLMNYIDYSKMNLRESFHFPFKFHMIFCRNVLIYQSVDGKKDILKRITDALEPGGFLILGCGESLLGLSDDYEQTIVDGAVIFRRKEKIIKAA